MKTRTHHRGVVGKVYRRQHFFRSFRQVFEEVRNNGRWHEIHREILLHLHLLSPLYDRWAPENLQKTFGRRPWPSRRMWLPEFILVIAKERTFSAGRTGRLVVPKQNDSSFRDGMICCSQAGRFIVPKREGPNRTDNHPTCFCFCHFIFAFGYMLRTFPQVPQF